MDFFRCKLQRGDRERPPQRSESPCTPRSPRRSARSTCPTPGCCGSDPPPPIAATRGPQSARCRRSGCARGVSAPSRGRARTGQRPPAGLGCGGSGCRGGRRSAGCPPPRGATRPRRCALSPRTPRCRAPRIAAARPPGTRSSLRTGLVRCSPASRTSPGWQPLRSLDCSGRLAPTGPPPPNSCHAPLIVRSRCGSAIAARCRWERPWCER
mmetsp:Transcript_24619/g.53717  ORF Transcript_24619/g.53717 Transcript_24619/m.53717 type:complete len:211 (-) Transcript_24619:153-785(-)